MIRRRSRLILASLVIATIASGTTSHSRAASASPAASLFSGMTWRQIGPFRGGRVLAVTGVPSEPDTYYLGAAIGGVWKTTDGGHLWTPLFDHERVGSIGAIAVAPSNPDVVYVGTGESAPREDVSFGDGVYRSGNGGRTWSHVGLPDSRHIARILVDPGNPNLVLVAALGHVYGPNPERGVFRSSDGGASWQKVLYKDDQTGAIDLAADPDHPATVFAALWQMQRTPWSLSSGGPGSGLYKSNDGGATWTPVSGHGLPAGVLGKIGVTVAAGTNGQRVYALIEADQGGLYRSDDGGGTWRLVNAEHVLWSRAWYFTKIWAHPKDPDTVFVAGNAFWKSTDGAKTFARVAIPGGDNHDFWANPLTPTHLIEANDQGIVISVNGGRTWDKRNNLPIGQFYHVSTDRSFPYSLYGAQQDMGAITIASRGWGGIGDRDWFNVGGDDGECGFVWPDPIDPRFVVAGGYNGAVTLFDKRSHQLRDIAPWSNASGGHPASDLKYRFTWTSPLVYSPVDPHVLYLGSQYLMETRNRGASWRVVSPDLTRNDKSKQGLSGGPITKDNASVEYYDVIFSIAPSPLQAGKIWVGTDDGLVQLTSDGGTTWNKVTPPGVPEWAKISLIEASRFDASTAFVAVDAHKLDDLQPYIFRTRDDGRTWTRITSGLQAPAHVYAVREDPKRKGLLFAGTETGIYVSFDEGDQWQSLQLNLPTTSVRDMTVNGNDLIVATHGRSFWALDDISPLRQATPLVAGESAHLFTPQTALRVHEADTYSIDAGPTGTNPPGGAVLDYYLGAKAAGEVSVEILDSRGRRAHMATSGSSGEAAGAEESPLANPVAGGDRPSADAGMHRLVWNLRYPLPSLIEGTAYDERAPRGVMAAPGAYRVVLKVAGRTYTAPLVVKNDPRATVSPEALMAEFTLASRLMGMLAEVHTAVREIVAVRKETDGLHVTLSSAPDAAQAVAAFERQADEVLNVLYEPKAKAGVDLLNYPMQLNARIAYLEDEVDFGDGAPTAQFYEMSRLYRRELDGQLARWKMLTETELPTVNRALQERGLPVVSIK